MYVPRARPGFHLPPIVLNGALYALAVLLALVAWGVISIARIRTDESYLTREAPGATASIDPSAFNMVAYTTRASGADHIWLMPVDGRSEPRLLATIPHINGLGVLYHAEVHGKASPHGDTIAVLAVPQADEQPTQSYAWLNLIDVSTGAVREYVGQYDALSPIAWSPDGQRVALVRSERPDESGRRETSIVEFDLANNAETVVAQFSGVFEAAPVGYSVDGSRLYLVTLDSGGSTLHAERDGAVTVVGQLSGGKTQDWTLNSDGTRLGYVEVLSTSAREYVGRAYHIGAAVAGELPPSDGLQRGVAWRPDSPIPDFGSLAGETWQLHPPPESPVFVWPLGWSPDGTSLITSIHSVTDGRVSPRYTLEMVVADRRVELEDGARFLGFVRGE